jgi:hypothetical protein
MPKFRVTVLRTAYRHATLEINADDPCKATEEARRLLSNDDIDWSSEKDAETEVDGVFSTEPLEEMPDCVRETLAKIRQEADERGDL